MCFVAFLTVFVAVVPVSVVAYAFNVVVADINAYVDAVPVSVVEVAYAFNVAVYVAAAAMTNSIVGKFDFP